MKFFFVLLAGVLPHLSSGQTIGYFSGGQQNTFFDLVKEKDGGRFSPKYESGNSYTFGLEFKPNKTNVLFQVRFENYGGYIEATDGGAPGTFTTKATVEKDIISLAIYPLYLETNSGFGLAIGPEIGRMVNSTYSGTTCCFVYNYDLQEEFKEFNRYFYFGFSGRVRWDIRISNQATLVPYVGYYLGLVSEFRGFPTATRSRRIRFGIGANWNLRPLDTI